MTDTPFAHAHFCLPNPPLVRSNLESTVRGLLRNGSDLAETIRFKALPSSGHLEKSISTGKPIPLAVRSKTWVCGRSPVETVVSNPTGGMDVCLLWVLCVVRSRSLRRGDQTSRRVLPTVVRRCVWSRNLVNEETLAHWGLLRQKNKKFYLEKSTSSISLPLLYVFPYGEHLTKY